MAELLWDSGYEEQYRKPQRMAVPPDTDVYLETVEIAQNPEEKADGPGITRMGCLWGRIQPKSLLEDGRKRGGTKGFNKCPKERDKIS